jgi:SUMO ligase MMS21 Smc5/6 complex component
MCGNGFTIYAQVPSAYYTVEEHKYNKLINIADEKPIGLVVAAQDDVVILNDQ